METTKLEEVLPKLKMLLGIEGEKQDELLKFLLDDTHDMILGYCRIDFLPRQLESLLPVIAADNYRAHGYGSETAPEVVKSISEGERSVSFAETTPSGDILANYYKRLDPFKNRKGRVPSEVKPIQ